MSIKSKKIRQTNKLIKNIKEQKKKLKHHFDSLSKEEISHWDSWICIRDEK